MMGIDLDWGRARKMGWYIANSELVSAKKRANRAVNRERDSKSRTAYRKAHPEKDKASSKKQSLALCGFTADEYDAQLVKQQGCCAICGISLKNGRGATSARADHDHVTGKRREILCGNCNFGLGHFKDSPDLLRKAAAYLESYLPLEFDLWPQMVQANDKKG